MKYSLYYPTVKSWISYDSDWNAINKNIIATNRLDLIRIYISWNAIRCIKHLIIYKELE